MASRKKSASKRASEGEDEIVVPEGVAPSPFSASGLAAAQRLGVAPATPEGEDRGSKVEIEGGEPEPDMAGLGGAPAPRGAQAEPAQFTHNGSLPHGMVPSPTGPVPVGAVAADPETGRALIEQQRATVARGAIARHVRLTEAQLAAMPARDIRALAHDRGYEDFPYAGARASRAHFLRRQDEDETLEEAEEVVVGGLTPTRLEGVIGTTGGRTLTMAEIEQRNQVEEASRRSTTTRKRKSR